MLSKVRDVRWLVNTAASPYLCPHLVVSRLISAATNGPSSLVVSATVADSAPSPESDHRFFGFMSRDHDDGVAALRIGCVDRYFCSSRITLAPGKSD